LQSGIFADAAEIKGHNFFVLSFFSASIDIRIMIHYSRLNMLMDRFDKDNRRIPFSLKFVKMSTGEVVSVNEAVCTSSFNQANTLNLLFLPSLQVRKIRRISIIEFNGQQVYY